jgi:hypothetical protein
MTFSGNCWRWIRAGLTVGAASACLGVDKKSAQRSPPACKRAIGKDVGKRRNGGVETWAKQPAVEVTPPKYCAARSRLATSCTCRVGPICGRRRAPARLCGSRTGTGRLCRRGMSACSADSPLTLMRYAGGQPDVATIARVVGVSRASVACCLKGGRPVDDKRRLGVCRLFERVESCSGVDLW